MASADSDILETNDLAQILRVSPSTIRLLDDELTARGILIGRTPRGARIYSRAGAEKFAAERRDAAAGSADAAVARAIEIENLYLTAMAAGDLIGCPGEELARLRRSGALRAVKVNGTWRFRRSDVERAAAERGR